MSTERQAADRAPSGAGSDGLSGLVLCGTLPRGWNGLAQALSGAMASRGQSVLVVVDGVSLAACSDDDAARFVAFVESPARCLALNPEAEVRQLLDAWSASVRELLRLSRRRPVRWCLVDVDESERSPQALADQLLGLDIDLPHLRVEAAAVDPLARFLADAVVARHRAVVRLYEEINACCVPLEEVTASASAAADLWGPHVDAWREASRLRAEQVLLLAQLRQAQQALEQSVHGARETESRARQAAAELTTQLQQAQHSLAAERAEHQAALGSSREALETTSKELAAAHARLKSEAIELEQRSDLVARSQRDQEALAAVLKEERAAHEATRADLGRAQAVFEQQHHQMLIHLHHVQEALEEQLMLNAPRQDSALARQQSIVQVSDDRVAALRMTGKSEKEPHLHVDMDLKDLRLGARHYPVLSVRLVEHAGHPGLLFWDGPKRAITAWRANGDEGGRSFMLMIPRTPDGRTTLQRLGSLDWRLVLGVARLLQLHLQDEGEALVRWAASAARLVRELEALPSRFRYDGTRVTQDPERGLQVSFEGARFGDRDLGTVVLQWDPPAQRLEWVAPALPQHLALSQWPTTRDGRLEPTMRLPVGQAMSDAERRRWWAQTSAADQAVLLALLDALPGAARSAEAAPLPAGLDAGRLADQAGSLHKQARRTLRGLQVRVLARRLVGGGGSPQ